MPTNRLTHEKSPYLLQHAHNPVDWYPWSDEAFEKARAEDKPVFLSIGYSTCHWCHVMERESFESEEIAAILNREFVSIKVDREERPDIDRIYMLFVQATSGSGGWPMSVWMTPDRRPFFGGTYFPPDNRYGRPGFPHILEQIAQAWKTRRAELVTSGDTIVEQLRQHAEFGRTSSKPDSASLDSCFQYFRRTYDSRLGGFGGAPKFPRPSVFHFLFRYFHHTGNQEASDMVLFTLREMAKGGMNDQLGGGFHRYSVDDRWFVPHFEKMLYDQGQLAASYLEAFQITGNSLYSGIARDIFEYVLRDMTHPEGGFYSAEDADSAADPAKPHEKGEGAFYIWTYSELADLLGEPLVDWFAHRYGVEEDGNVNHDPHQEFTGRNILYEASTLEETASRFNLNPDKLEASLATARETLLKARSLRPRPHLDDKILTGWNGLMISALAQGGWLLDEPRYRDAAVRAARFVLDRMAGPEPDTLLRRWRDGSPDIPGFLDDYALFVQALLDLYETTFDAQWLDHASRLTFTMIERFEDKSAGGFFSTPTGASDLILRMKEDYDGAEPSGNSIAVMNLLRLAEFTGVDTFAKTANNTLEAFTSRINQQSVTIPLLMSAFLYSREPEGQIVLAGDPAPFLPVLRRHFLPHSIRAGNNLATTKDMPALDGRPTAYVCQDFACQLPTTDPAKFEELIS